jgi:hypothetical protein
VKEINVMQLMQMLKWQSVHTGRDQNAASEEIGMDLAMGMWTRFRSANGKRRRVE